MKKNIFCEDAVSEIVTRVGKLYPGAAHCWGTMNATEMLYHLNLCNQELFEPQSIAKQTTLRQFLLRILALYIAPHFKKNVKGDRAKETKGKISPEHFEEQKAMFVTMVKKFTELRGPIHLHHVAFGNISRNEWGIALYKHMDHHLRQFGL